MYKQAPKTPAMKALVGNQPNLPQALRKAIENSPAKQTKGAGGLKAGDSGSTAVIRNSSGGLVDSQGQRQITTYNSSASGASPSNTLRDYEKQSVVAPTPKQTLNQLTETAMRDSLGPSYARVSGGTLKKAAKTKGVYQESRGKAVSDFNKKYGSGSPAQMKSPAKQVTNDQKAKSMEASKEKKVSVASGASKGKASTNREYVKGGRKKENGSREKSKTTKFSTTDGGKTYTKTTTKGKQGKVKVKTKEISGTKAKRQADRLNKKYTQV